MVVWPHYIKYDMQKLSDCNECVQLCAFVNVCVNEEGFNLKNHASLPTRVIFLTVLMFLFDKCVQLEGFSQSLHPRCSAISSRRPQLSWKFHDSFHLCKWVLKILFDFCSSFKVCERVTSSGGKTNQNCGTIWVEPLCRKFMTEPFVSGISVFRIEILVLSCLFVNVV